MATHRCSIFHFDRHLRDFVVVAELNMLCVALRSCFAMWTGRLYGKISWSTSFSQVSKGKKKTNKAIVLVSSGEGLSCKSMVQKSCIEDRFTGDTSGFYLLIQSDSSVQNEVSAHHPVEVVAIVATRHSRRNDFYYCETTLHNKVLSQQASSTRQ